MDHIVKVAKTGSRTVCRSLFPQSTYDGYEHTDSSTIALCRSESANPALQATAALPRDYLAMKTRTPLMQATSRSAAEPELGRYAKGILECLMITISKFL